MSDPNKKNDKENEDIILNVDNEADENDEDNAPIEDQSANKLCGIPIKYWIAIAGSIIIILIIAALIMNEVWNVDMTYNLTVGGNKNTGDIDGSIGWKKIDVTVEPDPGGVITESKIDDNLSGTIKQRGAIWLALTIMGMFFAIFAVIWSLVADKMESVSEGTKKSVTFVGFVLAFAAVFVGNVLAASYRDGPNVVLSKESDVFVELELRPGHSVTVAIVAAIAMIIPLVLIRYGKRLSELRHD